MGGEAGWATQPAGFGMHEVFSAGLEEMHNAVNAAMAEKIATIDAMDALALMGAFNGRYFEPAEEEEQKPGVLGRVLMAISRTAPTGCNNPVEEVVKLKNLDNKDKYGNVIAYQPQGLAVGTTYCYSFEVTIGNADHNLYRIPKTGTNKTPELMTNKNNAVLGHANDVALATYNNKLYMYVVTFSTDDIVKLEYDGSGNYWQRAKYSYTRVKSSLASPTQFNGISLIGNSNSAVYFLAQAFDYFYVIEIPFDDNGQMVVVNEAFRIPRMLGGRQTFHYQQSNNKVYVVFQTSPKNVVAAYSAVQNTQEPSEPWRINGSNTFEVEGGGLYSDIYWFTTWEGYSLNGALYTHSEIK